MAPGSPEFQAAFEVKQDDRRNWPRIDLDTQALLQFDRVGPEISSRIVNASAKGLFLVMDPVRPIGTRISIEVVIADVPTRLCVTGVVVHTVERATRDEPVGVGICLTEVGDDWIDFCDQLASATAR